MNTQSTKKSFKLNFFDILLIVLGVLIIAAVSVYFLVSNATGTTAEETKTVIEYTVLVKDLPAEMQIHADPGETVQSSIYFNRIGKVVSHEKMPATYDAFDYENETTVHGEYSDIYNVAFTFRTESVKTDASYFIGHVRISVGAEVHFRLPQFVGFGFVTDVKEITVVNDTTKDTPETKK